MPKAYEVNFDGLVGPTHNYAGLSFGNVASLKHRSLVSHPKEAALQGLAKMKLLAELGVKQAILPPQPRPDLRTLRRLGFSGSDADVVHKAHREAPEALAACYSASAMWTANAAAVSPSADAADGRAHFTAANLVSQFHRSLEPSTTSSYLRAIFPDAAHFAHHDPLPAGAHFCDEGAANHMRLCRAHGEPGLEIFTYGRRAFDYTDHPPLRFPARQTYEASAAVARLHRLDAFRTLFLQQNPQAIDAGVFHNDVIAVANENVLLCHEAAFRGADARDEMRKCFDNACGAPPGAAVLHVLCIGELEVPLADAIGSYLFNSQLVTLPDGSMALIVPAECFEYDSTRQWLETLPSRHAPIRSVHTVNLRQSMQNGGGPACLRLRVVLTDEQLAKVHPGALFNDELHDRLAGCITRHYRDELRPEDLADPALIDEARGAVEELWNILDWKPFAPAD